MLTVNPAIVCPAGSHAAACAVLAGCLHPQRLCGWVLSLTLCLRVRAFNYARQGKQIEREGQPLLGSQKVYEDNDDGDPLAVKIALSFRETDMLFDRAASCPWLLFLT